MDRQQIYSLYTRVSPDQFPSSALASIYDGGVLAGDKHRMLTEC